jgi:hypothetical protein
VAGPGLGGGGEYVPGVTVVSVATLCAAFEKMRARGSIRIDNPL